MQNPKLLLVDDRPDIIRLLRRRLTKKGYCDVHIARNGQEAVDMAMKLRPDVTLMDMHMPILDGYAATKTLREQGFTGLIVACTASAMADDIARVKQAGCDEFIAKPIEPDFERRLEEMIRKHCHAA